MPPSSSLSDVVSEVVDYMLFVDEAPLEGARGTSGLQSVLYAGTPRREEAVAPRFRSAAQAVSLPVQLHDLLGCVQRTSRPRPRCSVQTVYGRFCPGATRRRGMRDCRPQIARRSSRSCDTKKDLPLPVPIFKGGAREDAAVSDTRANRPAPTRAPARAASAYLAFADVDQNRSWTHPGNGPPDSKQHAAGNIPAVEVASINRHTKPENR